MADEQKENTTPTPVPAPTSPSAPATPAAGFKQRVVREAIAGAKLYKTVFVDWEYLVCSDAFTKCNYYTISGIKGNYCHLVGVHSLIKPEEFYDKCFDGTLDESDFDFIKKGYDEKSVRGTVRQKIMALPMIDTIFDDLLLAQEDFKKNSVSCTFASATTSTTIATLGFIGSYKAKPMTLLRGNKLTSNAKPVDLVLRRPAKSKSALFSEIIVGSDDEIKKYWVSIKDIVDPKLKPAEPAV